MTRRNRRSGTTVGTRAASCSSYTCWPIGVLLAVVARTRRVNVPPASPMTLDDGRCSGKQPALLEHVEVGVDVGRRTLLAEVELRRERGHQLLARALLLEELGEERTRDVG